MAAHARLSSSNTKTWSTCAGQIPIMEQRPQKDSGDNYFADLGTCAHHLVEQCLREGTEPADYEGRFIKIIDKSGGTSMLRQDAKVPVPLAAGTFVVDQDMIEATTKMIWYVRHRCVELGLAAENDLMPPLARQVAKLVENGTVRLEVHVTPLPNRNDTGGTGDVVIDAWPELIEVVDYKNGSGVFVPVTKNHQLRSYGLGTLNEFGFDDYERVVYTICQPRHTESPPDGIMSEEMTVKDMKAWGNWLHGRAEEVDVARAMVAKGAGMQELFDAGLLSVGEDGSACHWCELQAECPAKRAKAQELCELDFDDDPFAPDPVTSTNHLAVLIPWVPFLESWLKSIMQNGELELLAGNKVSGQKLVHGKSTRKRKPDTEDNDVLAYLAKLNVTDLEKMTNPAVGPTLRTIPQLEKLLPAKLRKAFSDEFTDKPEGKLTMVSIDDDRDEVLINVGDDFDDNPEVPA